MQKEIDLTIRLKIEIGENESVENYVQNRLTWMVSDYPEGGNDRVKEEGHYSVTEVDKAKDIYEVIADLAYEAGNAGFGKGTDSREVNQTIVFWAKEFMRKHKNTDWYEVDYLEEILNFTSEKIEAGNAQNTNLVCPECGSIHVDILEDEGRVVCTTCHLEWPHES